MSSFISRLSGLFDLSGSSGWFSDPVNKTDQTDQRNETDLIDQKDSLSPSPTSHSGPDNSELITHNSELPQTGGMLSRGERGILRGNERFEKVRNA